ncbi:MADS-box transcription factor 26 [Dioscorea cayenensis subsp. rotundata]|uniref:MADS-box transcription factor 26 n=1 Tax=Dioscorea cayennensis subsp. rotundata TaxID=55577 RepID=A0AB40BGN7_DIOCR|nr:MADS-box transcription factor 26 [Dioscorea cayenensis subsp. rotundata]XP_039126412.1 MADS-box transcription factor 26 [Dioscorea cayenensis subsp. rotundata]
MARGKVQMRRIENPVHRQVTFCKRRAGLLKKARELSVLCDAEIGIIIFSTHGKLYELATKGNMQSLIERYKNSCAETQAEGAETNQTQETVQEISKMKQEIDLLQKGLKYMFGERTMGHMTLDELQSLEKYLEIWMNHTRAAKMQIMFMEIQALKNKEGILKAANELLQEKILEQNGVYDVSPMIADIQYPLTIHSDSLTIQNELFQF